MPRCRLWNGMEMEGRRSMWFVLWAMLDDVWQPLPAAVSCSQCPQEGWVSSVWGGVQLTTVSVLPSRQEAPPERGAALPHLWENVHSHVEQEEAYGVHTSCVDLILAFTQKHIKSLPLCLCRSYFTLLSACIAETLLGGLPNFCYGHFNVPRLFPPFLLSLFSDGCLQNTA